MGRCAPDTVAAAAATNPKVSATNFSIVDAGAPDAYPVAGYSWVVVYKKPTDPIAPSCFTVCSRGWSERKGSDNAESVDYVPLPTTCRRRRSDPAPDQH